MSLLISEKVEYWLVFMITLIMKYKTVFLGEVVLLIMVLADILIIIARTIQGVLKYLI